MREKRAFVRKEGQGTFARDKVTFARDEGMFAKDEGKFTRNDNVRERRGGCSRERDLQGHRRISVEVMNDIYTLSSATT